MQVFLQESFRPSDAPLTTLYLKNKHSKTIYFITD